MCFKKCVENVGDEFVSGRRVVALIVEKGLVRASMCVSYSRQQVEYRNLKLSEDALELLLGKIEHGFGGDLEDHRETHDQELEAVLPRKSDQFVKHRLHGFPGGRTPGPAPIFKPSGYFAGKHMGFVFGVKKFADFPFFGFEKSIAPGLNFGEVDLPVALSKNPPR